MSKSRTKNSISNSLFGIMSYFITFIFAFISRKVFSVSLGSEFLGLNSFFSNIVSMLTITELGLSTAIIFFLYAPISKNDQKKIKAYIFFTKKLYMVIAAIISIIGIILTIFLDVFAETTLNMNTVRIYFLLYLASTVATYFYAYKKSILYADQKNRIVAIVHTVSKIAFETTQMIVIYLTKSYYFYLILLIISNFLENYVCSKYVDKYYPYLKNKENDDLSKLEKKDLYIKTKNLFIQNISSFIVTSTDNILISTFINVTTVGIYSNYVLLTSTLKTVFSQIFSAFTTSFGNLAVTESKEKSYIVFKNAYFFSFWFSSITCIMYLLLIQPFIALWMGDSYLFNYTVPILLSISYYVINMNVPAISVQNALGLHHVDKNIMMLQALFNLVLSILFVNFIGIQGIILGTIISTLLFPTLSKPYVIYKYVFEKKVAFYYFEWIKQAIVMSLTFVISYMIVSKIVISNLFVSFVVKAFLSFIIPNMIYIILFRKKEEFNYFKTLIFRIIHK